MRAALLESYLMAGLVIGLWTEFLSCFSALRLEFAWPCWILIALFALLRLGAVLRRARVRTMLWWELALASALLAIVTTVGATAMLSAPNSADAMAYHLPRVIYWLQQESVQFFPTVYFNQISMPPLAEYAALHTFLVSGGDRLVNLVQLSGFVVAIVASRWWRRNWEAEGWRSGWRQCWRPHCPERSFRRVAPRTTACLLD